MASSAYPVTVKWGKDSITLQFVPEAGAMALKNELSAQTGVPADRMKLMAKSKGLWKGVLKDDTDFQSLDWRTAHHKAGSAGLQLLLMGSSGSAATTVNETVKTVFLEDLPPEEVAKVQEPSGLVNLGNTCYLNSVVQCLRAVPPLRQGLEGTGARGTGPVAMLVMSLRDAYHRMDRQTEAFQPVALVQATRLAFPRFAERSRTGGLSQFQQQDAEEFYSHLLTAVAGETEGVDKIRAGLPQLSASSQELLGASNLVDALFGLKMKETLTCDELSPPALPTAAATTATAADATAPMDTTTTELFEPPVVTYDLHRKLVCNIQGGSDGTAQANVSHIAEGIALSLQGKIEKHSDILGRNAVWTRTQRIARLPPCLVIQFGRFYWKATPDSQDHAGVKCKVMKPVAFSSELDVYEFCTPEIQQVLKVARDKALAEEEDRISKKLKGQMIEEGTGNGDKKDEKIPAVESSTMEAENTLDEDAALEAALAMSLETNEPATGSAITPVGPGLPDNFRGIYELFAVVTHKGRDADGGHYMAWVKADHGGSPSATNKIADTDELNEDWYVFDDDEVSPCKTEDILKLKGGGDWHMSYLNFYRAKK